MFINYIKNKYATDNNIKYDNTMVIRPESIVNDVGVILKIIKNNTSNIIYGSEWYGLGPTNLMDIYCNKPVNYYKEFDKTIKHFNSQDELIMKKNNAKFISRDIFSVQIPYNSYVYASLDLVKLVNTKSGRVFLVTNYEEKNNIFQEKYKKVSDDIINEFKEKYIELF